MTPKLRIIVFLLPAIAMLACSLTDRLISPAPTMPVVTPILVQPSLPPPETVPSPTMAPLPQAQIGVYTPLYLTYDPGTWLAGLWLTSDGTPMQSIQHALPVEALTHAQYACEIHDNLGHGMGPGVEYTTNERQVGNLLYRVDQWVDTATGDIVLVVYQYPTGQDGRRIEMVVKDANGPLCVQAMEEVLKSSEGAIAGG